MAAATPASTTSGGSEVATIERNVRWQEYVPSKSDTRAFSSDAFKVGEAPFITEWKVTYNQDGPDFNFSLDLWNMGTLETVSARGVLRLLHLKSDSKTIVREVPFTTLSDDRLSLSFPKLISATTLRDPKSGYSSNSKFELLVKVIVAKPTTPLPIHNGLRNQGATCYLNSLIQALFHTSPFRRAVYTLTTSGESELSIPLALQRLFFEMQFGQEPAQTRELTQSFGWTTAEAYVQHDVQELNRVLCDCLKKKFKGTSAEGIIDRLWMGKSKNFIKCLKVDYTSAREEIWYDLQLQVRNCKDIYASLDKYVEVELMTGDNKYQAEGYGLQDAKKGTIFKSLPPILHLQLKRFTYDYQYDRNVKINDQCAFPEVLKMDKYVDGGSTGNDYMLQGVLVHSGGVSGGHYYAFFRPSVSGAWYKFDDSTVTRARKEEAIDANFGGEQPNAYRSMFGTTYAPQLRVSNAYMLVYFRASDWQRLLEPVPESAVPPHVSMTVAERRKERELKQKLAAEAHLYCQIRLIRERDLAVHQHPFDLIDPNAKLTQIRIKKLTKLADLKDEIYKLTGVLPHHQRLWPWGGRKNSTYRPEAPFSPAQELSMTCEMVGRGDIFLEEAQLPPTVLVPSPFPPYTSADARIFIKFYHPEDEKLTYVSSIVVDTRSKLGSLFPILRSLLPPHLQSPSYLLFEEVRESMQNLLNPHKTFVEEELGTGDIVVGQTPPSFGTVVRTSFPIAKNYYQYFHNRTTVAFRELHRPTSASEFQLELSTTMTYDEVANRLGARLQSDPRNLRLTRHNTATGSPATAIRRSDTMLLPEMLRYNFSSPHILYYECLSVSLSEYETKRDFRIGWQNAKGQLVETYSVLVDLDAKVSDLMEKLKAVVPLVGKAGAEPMSGEVRLMEIWSNRIEKILVPTQPVRGIVEHYIKLRAEERGVDELDAKPGDLLLRFCHVTSEFWRYFDNPFAMLVRKGETVGSVRSRVRQKLGVTEEKIQTWRFVSMGSSTLDRIELRDDSVVDRLDWGPGRFMGLVHAQTGGDGDGMGRLYGGIGHRPKERAIVIRG